MGSGEMEKDGGAVRTPSTENSASALPEATDTTAPEGTPARAWRMFLRDQPHVHHFGNQSTFVLWWFSKAGYTVALKNKSDGEEPRKITIPDDILTEWQPETVLVFSKAESCALLMDALGIKNFAAEIREHAEPRSGVEGTTTISDGKLSNEQTPTPPTEGKNA